VAKWVSFLGEKYKYVHKFKICLFDEGESLGEPDILEGPLANALSNMINLATYVIEICPKITSRIFDNMEKKQHQIKKFTNVD
jgi:hypothetical protein